MVYQRFSRVCVGGAFYTSHEIEWFQSLYEGEFMAKFLGQVVAAQKAASGEEVPYDEGFEKSFPAIWEFVSVTRLDGGKSRETATLLFFLEGRHWKVCLGDRESGMSLWAAAETHWEALEALEAMLQSSSPQWRKSGKRVAKK